MHERLELPSGISEAAVLPVLEPIRRAIRERLIPGASAAIRAEGRTIRYAAGLAVDTAELQIPARLDTLYDCASLTKVTVTLPLVLKLTGEGRLHLEDPIARYFPAFDSPDKKAITIRQLLAHTAGFRASADFYSVPCGADEALSRIAAMPLEYRPGTSCVYSDLGYIVLGQLIPQAAGMPLEEAARQYIWGPLGMASCRFVPDPALAGGIAATEYSEALGDCWRGIVHDENARAFGGVSGHAGLFAAADDLLRYAARWLEGAESSGFLPQRLRAEALAAQTPALPGMNRGLGWVLKDDRADVTGTRSSARAFGHTGFTGTSLMIDPVRKTAAVLLTNRVHYGRGRDITRLRTDFHDAAAGVLPAAD